jgi:hypothetical protein
MFPNKMLDGGIFRNSFIESSDCAIFGLQAFHWSVVNVGNGDMGDFRLKDISDVIVKYGYRILQPIGMVTMRSALKGV